MKIYVLHSKSKSVAKEGINEKYKSGEKRQSSECQANPFLALNKIDVISFSQFYQQSWFCRHWNKSYCPPKINGNWSAEDEEEGPKGCKDQFLKLETKNCINQYKLIWISYKYSTCFASLYTHGNMYCGDAALVSI